jgi:phosphatidylserine/phosphatidylglycerophosphate/cardiolipin synthase-like enzyme
VSAAIVRAAERGVEITLVLESAEASAGKVAHEALEGLGHAVERMSIVYVWPLDQRLRDCNGNYGSLHVKCAIADDSAILVSSANLTEFALNLNMELGVLIRGGDVPHQVAEHIRSLIQSGVLRRIGEIEGRET